MILSDASTSRPIAMSCLLIGLAFLGGNAYRKIGLEMIPQVDIPYVTIVTAYPGASPEDVETDVAKRIEDAVASVDGLKNLTSKCLEDVCQTMMEFEMEIDVDVASQDVREKIDAIINDFPSGVERPVIQKIDIGAKAILTLCLMGELDIDELYDYADEYLGDRFAALPGVAEVELIGGAEREVHIEIDRDRLAATGLTSLDVLNAIQAEVARVPAGRIRAQQQEYSVQYRADYTELDKLADLQVAGRDGARAYIRDLAQVRYGTEERRQAAFLDGKPAIGLQIVKRSDANAVAVVDRVRTLFDEYQQPGRLPAGMSLVWFRDDREFIQASVNSTTFNIIDGVLMTAAILFLFLWNARTTMVVAVSMPMTILVGLFVVNMMGYTLNTMTLLAIGLSVGVLVSNSIVVLENIESHFRRHGDSWKAAREGTNEVAVAVLASAGTNIVVMFPIALMGGMVGRIFRSFAWTTVAVNGASLFISFTLTPILAAVLLRPPAKGSMSERMGVRVNGWIRGAAAAFMGRLGRLGNSRLRSAGGLAVLTVALVAVARWGGGRIGFDMFPSTDNAEITVRLEYPTYQNLETTSRRVLEAARLLDDLPGLVGLFAYAGRCDGMGQQASEGVYLGQISIRLVQKTDPVGRPDIHEILRDVRRRLAAVDDCIATAGLTGMMGGQDVPINMEIAGEDPEELEAVVRGALAQMGPGGKLAGFESPDSTIRPGKPQLRIEPRRATLADTGLAASQLGLLLRTNLEGTKAGTFRAGSRTFDIRTKFTETEGKEQVRDFLFPTAEAGVAVTLETYADVVDSDVQVMVNRADKTRIAMLFAQKEPTAALGTMMDELSGYVRGNLLKPGYTLTYRGSGQNLNETIGYFVEAVVLALVMTYLMLGAILESFSLPLYIFITIPLGLVGVILGLVYSGENITIFAMLGIVMLIGIVVNNAVLVIDRMNQFRAQGVSDGLAMKNAVVTEMRAVLMVTFAAAAGMWPLATATDIGGEMTVGIGWASIGGIALSSILLLLALPLMWWLLHPIRAGEEDAPVPDHHADYIPGAGSSSRRFVHQDGTVHVERPHAADATIVMESPFKDPTPPA